MMVGVVCFNPQRSHVFVLCRRPEMFFCFYNIRIRSLYRHCLKKEEAYNEIRGATPALCFSECLNTMR